ncbi:lasso peptide biosynthesis B2 protein [Nostoc sp. MG11]|uniref:lasso peptide biosynthesis B2 protein n=1 Tax=Nostoc sp. MG11 TaxID=2721166 RepID=UPI001866EACE|nr:lasso peptide biosynthesis B2 protein [Nostoc sp. MG11]
MDVETALNPISVKVNLVDRLKGLAAVTIAYTILRLLSMEKICSIITSLKHLCSHQIDIGEADLIWATVHKSSFLFSGRVACLEASLAFVILALSKGLSSTWCVGVATEPFRAHAWVEIDGKPFHESHYVEQFKALFTV